MKRVGYIFVGLLILTTLACNKRVTPNKVERIITQDSWKIQRFVNNGVEIKDTFALDLFVFDEHNNLKIPNRPEIGSWFLTSAKNPAVIEFNLPTNTNLAYLADDWNMVYLNKNEFHLERKDGQLHSSDLLYFVRLN